MQTGMTSSNKPIVRSRKFMSRYAKISEALYAVGLDIVLLDELLGLAISESSHYNDEASCVK